jgi:N-acetylneuraminic acid mutarotase
MIGNPRNFFGSAALACAVACSLFWSSPAPAQPSRQVLHSHVRPAVSNGQAALVGALPPAQSLNVSIVLPLRNQAGLTALLGRLYDPSSPDYRHFLSVEQFTEQFGPTAEDYQTVVDFVHANGLTVTDTPANRMTVPVNGTVAQIEKTFHVSMKVYRHPAEDRTFFSPDREPSLDLSVPVAHIVGLNNFSIPRPMLTRLPAGQAIANFTGAGPGGSYLASDMRAAYYGGTALTGSGQAVGLFELDGYNLSDVNLTFSNAGQSYSVPINNVLLDGVTGANLSGDDGEEVLDIVQAIGMAPGLSQVRVYIGTSDYDILNTMASENICKQLSISWGWSPDDPTTDDPVFQEFVAQGQSVFVASGDKGAYDAQVLPAFYPAEDAWVTAVGGTSLVTTGAGGSWVSETAWNSPAAAAGGGGGISPDGIAIPSWQVGVANASNGGSTTLRNVPDVAAEADLSNYFCDMGTCGATGGTSFAAPRWAGFMALVNQQAVALGSAPLGGVGFINPAIYSLAESSSYASDLHDIASGNNDCCSQPVWYNAVTGYDLVTGWGSPNGQSLIDALAPTPTGPGFTLVPTPANVSIIPGGSSTTTIAVNARNGFTGNVTLAASNLPSGVTASFSTNPTTGSSTLTLTASATTALGTSTVTITGNSSGVPPATNTVTLTVNPPPGFTLSASPSNPTVHEGASTTSTITVIDVGGFTGSVTLSASGLPSGVTASFSPNPTTNSSVLTLTASATAATGASTVTIAGSSTSGQSATVNLSLTVYPTPSFSLSANPNSLTVAQNSSASSTVTVTDVGGFVGWVNLTASGLPSGVTASFNANSAMATSVLTLTAGAAAAIGTSTVTINGSYAGTPSASTPLTLTVTGPPPGFALLANPGGLTVAQGASGASTLTVAGASGFSGSVTLAASNLPSGVTASFGANPTAGTSVLTLTASPTAALGIAEVTVTGNSPGVPTVTVTLPLMVTSSASALNEWTWMSGSTTIPFGQGNPGVYGALGVPAAGNVPGSRRSASSWTDSSGNLWLFGGYGWDSNGNSGPLNDLWEFNPSTNEWAWMNGSNTSGKSGVYGTLGIPAAGNSPGSRYNASSWTDSSGHFWLFGGDAYDANGTTGNPNDLWEFNPSTNQWAWMGGSSTVPSVGYGNPGVYGTLGAFAAGNIPGGRYYASSWTDGSGHLWLFGGYGTDSRSWSGNLTDLWEFNPSINQWAWMGGSNKVPTSNNGAPGVYGTFGVPAAGNIPGSRECAATWTDSSGNLWLFGGNGYDVANNYGPLNDLWEFNTSTNQWAWMGGSSTTGSFGVLGALGAPAAANVPGARDCASTFTDRSGNLWLFGGAGFDASGNRGSLNDWWVFSPSANEWTWMAGSSTAGGGNSGVYGTLGVPAAGNLPGSRDPAGSWTDGSGNFWIFGGAGTDGRGYSGYLNDLWRYQPAAAPAPTPGFVIGASPVSLVIAQGASGASTVAVADVGGFTGSVSFAVSGLPSGVTAAFSPNPTTGSSTLTLTANSTAALGAAMATVTGSAAGVPAASATLSLTVKPPPGFTIAPALGSLTITQGTSGASVVTVTDVGGFTGNVTLAASGLPNGVTATFSQNPTTLSSLLTLTASSTAALGTSTVTVTGSSTGVPSATTTLNLTVNPAPGFTLAASPNSLVLTQGGSGASTVSVTDVGGFTGSVTLSASGLPSGVTATFSPNPTTGSSTLTLTASSTAALGAATVTIAGSSAGVPLATTTLSLTVNPAPGFTLAASPGALTIFQGGSGVRTVTVTDVSGFTGNVSLAASGLPSGVTAAFNPNPTTGSSTLTLAASSTAAVGSATVTIAGSATGVASATTTITLSVITQASAANDWTWMGGSSTTSGPGNPSVYGTLGVPAAGNIPGSRSGASTWTDSSGNLWLFGGNGYNAMYDSVYFNELWEFNPSTNQWAWMGGSNTVPSGGSGNPGVYGALGVAAAGNIPGGRGVASTWTDKTGHLWLFGGYGVDAKGALGYLNDLWEFNPSTNQWAWMGGSSTIPSSGKGNPGAYGALGVPSAGNIPGARNYASTWTDTNGNLWLFGGLGYSSSTPGYLNDLWEFSPSTNEWAWMGGSSTVPGSGMGCNAGVYGAFGVPAAGNIPGGRQAASNWIDSSGNLWLFGGQGCDANDTSGLLSELWEFSPSTNQWAWMGGSSTVPGAGKGNPGVYGALGVPATGNIPGGRAAGPSWTDSSGHFWLFGGAAYDAVGNSGYVNDLWEFNPSANEWAWMGGSSTVPAGAVGNPAVYGALGVPATGNLPGGRVFASRWTDSSGHLWLFGGSGCDANDEPGNLNDLWEYQPAGPAQTPGFTLAANPNSLTIAQGASGASTVTATEVGGFTGSVTLAASGLPSGVTATFSPNPTTGSSTLTLTASSTAVLGAATVTITGSSTGVPSATTTLNLTVNPPPGFTLAANPNTLTVAQGASGVSTVTVSDIGGFTGSVTLSASGLPGGVTATFSPNPATGSSTLTLTASSTAALGAATVTISGNATGVPSATTTLNLTVNPPPGFTLSASPGSLTIAQGASGVSTVSVSDVGGFTGSVTLAASGLPGGITATFVPNPTTGSSTLTLTASSTAVLGPATVTITGSSTGVPSATTTLNLTVNPPPGFTLAANPNSLVLAQGASGVSTVAVSDVGGFTGSVTLAASGLPSGVTATFSPNPTTGSSTLTLTASSTAVLGAATVTITGSSTGVPSATTTLNLTVNPPPGFTLAANPSSLVLAQGASGVSTVAVSDVGGFTGSVTLAASGLPTGVTATFVPNPTTGSSTLTLTASSTALLGAATVTITGSATGVPSATTTLNLTVNPPPGFTLAANPNSLVLAQGASGVSTVSVTDIGGFTGSVTLSASGLPTGVTATFVPNPTTGSSTLTLTASSTAVLGAATVTITGSATGLPSATTTLNLTVNPPPGFTLAANPSSLVLAQGASGVSTVSVTDIGGFTGSVTLAASGLPSGVTATFSPNPTTGSSTLTLTASSTAVLGAATVTITGSATGVPSATTTLNLTVNPPPGFTLAANPSSLVLAQGASGVSTISVTDLGGFTGSVTLAASGLPSGVTATFSPNPTTGSSTLTLTASSTAVLGAATVTITGSATGVPSATTTLNLTVNPPPGFTLAANPSSLVLAQGASGVSTVSVTDIGGFTGSVTLAASGLPGGVTATFVPNPTTGRSTLTLTASSTAVLGAATVTITGSATGVPSATTTLNLTVNPPPGFTLSASPGSLTIAQGASGVSTIKVSDIGGFAGSVTLAASGLPGGVTATFAPNPTTGSSTLTLTASSTAVLGAATVKITGSATGIPSASTTLSLTVNPPPGFTLTADSNSLTVAQTTSGVSTIKVTDVGGFTGSVTLSASGLPSGVTATFVPNPTTGSSTLTLTASSTAALGAATVKITGSSTGVPSATTTLTLTVTPLLACHVGYSIASQWDSGFQAAITIGNTGTQALTNWTLTWTFANGQTVTELWDGTVKQSGANVTVTNLSYNGSIPAGSSVTGVGFNGTWNNKTNQVPTSFAVNGTVCK